MSSKANIYSSIAPIAGEKSLPICPSVDAVTLRQRAYDALLTRLAFGRPFARATTHQIELSSMSPACQHISAIMCFSGACPRLPHWAVRGANFHVPPGQLRVASGAWRYLLLIGATRIGMRMSLSANTKMHSGSPHNGRMNKAVSVVATKLRRHAERPSRTASPADAGPYEWDSTQRLRSGHRARPGRAPRPIRPHRRQARAYSLLDAVAGRQNLCQSAVPRSALQARER